MLSPKTAHEPLHRCSLTRLNPRCHAAARLCTSAGLGRWPAAGRSLRQAGDSLACRLWACLSGSRALLQGFLPSRASSVSRQLTQLAGGS